MVDTNVLLDLYRLSVPAREEALAVLEAAGQRLWVPSQVTEEFRRHVDDVRGELAAAYAKSRDVFVKASNQAKTTFGARSRWQESRRDVHGLIDRTVMALCSQIDELMTADAAIVVADDDPILRRIDRILEMAGADEPDPEVVRRRVEDFVSWRAPNRIPPGFRDVAAKHTPLLQAGDYLLWSELLDHAARTATPFLLVTNDRKDDWFAQDGTPLRALQREFALRSAHGYHQMAYEDFLAVARTAFGTDVAEATLVEVVEERRANITEAAERITLREIQETAGLLTSALERLEERQRSVVVLRHYEGMSDLDIARILDLAPDEVSQIYHQGMASLRWNMMDSVRGEGPDHPR